VVDAQGDEVGHAIYDAYGQMLENTILDFNRKSKMTSPNQAGQ
jgi:hypothetical protein